MNVSYELFYDANIIYIISKLKWAVIVIKCLLPSSNINKSKTIRVEKYIRNLARALRLQKTLLTCVLQLNVVFVSSPLLAFT